MADSGDVVLQIQNTSSLLQYNDLIYAVERMIQEIFLEKVGEAKFFSVCADEAADSSNKEQLSLVLRFVDKEVHHVKKLASYVYWDVIHNALRITSQYTLMYNKPQWCSQ